MSAMAALLVAGCGGSPFSAGDGGVSAGDAAGVEAGGNASGLVTGNVLIVADNGIDTLTRRAGAG